MLYRLKIFSRLLSEHLDLQVEVKKILEMGVIV